ncbi:YtcA family lipoprotein [Devosia ginsengisoli]|nr:YtcA family lipoprotein [Devosia ginsengisoli]
MTSRISLPAMALFSLVLAGCSATGGTPAVPIFGSFFPAWIICAVGGIILAVILRAVLIALRIDEHLPAPPLVYLCLAVSGGIGLWMIWSGVA